MAHQTPQFPSIKDAENIDLHNIDPDTLDPDSLNDEVMISYLCGLFTGNRKTKEKHESCDEALDAITFPSLPETGPRKKKSLETMQSIIDRLYDSLNTLNLLRKFRYDVEDLRESKPGPEAPSTEHDDRRLQDAVNLSALVITYWENVLESDDLAANEELPAMIEASRLIADLMEGIQDKTIEAWDRVTKDSLNRTRLWLQMGGLDKNAPYSECYQTEVPNKDGAGDQKPTRTRAQFPCNECPEVFDIAVGLEDHLRQKHDGRGLGTSLGKTLRSRIFGSLTRSMRSKGRVENDRDDEVADPSSIGTAPAPAPSTLLTESWLEVAPALDEVFQPVQCPTCSNTFASVTALHDHYKSEHSETENPDFSTDLNVADQKPYEEEREDGV